MLILKSKGFNSSGKTMIVDFGWMPVFWCWVLWLMWAKDFLELSKYQLNKGALESLRCWSEEKCLYPLFSHYVPSLIPWVNKKQRFACEVVPIGLGSRIRFPVQWTSKLSWTKKDVFPLGVASVGRYQAKHCVCEDSEEEKPCQIQACNHFNTTLQIVLLVADSSLLALSATLSPLQIVQYQVVCIWLS